MKHSIPRFVPLLCLIAGVAAAADSQPLAGYRTVREAISTEVRPATQGDAGLSGYLGVALELDAKRRLLVADVGPDSPAARAGVRAGDVLLSLDGQPVATVEEARRRIEAKAPNDPLKLSLHRGRTSLTLTATIGALSRPMKVGEARAVIGVRVSTPREDGGITLTSVRSNQPAATAGLRAGDILLRADGAELGEALSLTDKMSEYKPGDVVTFTVRRGAREFERAVTLATDDSPVSEENRPLRPWKKDTYRLAVVLVEFPDQKHNTNVPSQAWADAYFSHGTYTTTNATGQKAYGSMADYYAEISCGKLKVEGTVFDWVEAPRKRAEYNTGRTGSTRATLFTNILEAVQARDGRQVLEDFDGLAVVYAGERFPGANRGSILWAHRSSVTVAGKSWPYVIVAEGGKQMASISTMCHETGHILGLPDLYARPENPGSEGAGTWCAMSNQSPQGRPQHFSAWCKEQLGWLTPVVIDPAVKQKLVLSPVEGATNECFKVLVRPDGSEYFLLENRRKRGFDASLSGEGLLIWRVVANRPILEESHGVAGPPGPRAYLPSVPYPSKANEAFTPFTTPSSRAQLPGGHPVWITNIREWPDGRVSFQIGQEFQ